VQTKVRVVQKSQLRQSLRNLKREGFRHIFVLESEDAVNSVRIERVALWNDKKNEHGPFDIIGDVHGCCDELEKLLQQLGYQLQEAQPADPLWGNQAYVHPEKRTAVFLGDIVDRGPRIIAALRTVRNMAKAGTAYCVPGNHDSKLRRKLSGKDVQITHGLQESLAEIEGLPYIREPFAKEASEFIDGLISHYIFDNGKLVVAHAGMREEMQGRCSAKVRDFALYGETTGETDEFGLPVRYNWAAEYRGQAMVVYGHTPVPEPEWLNRTINIDTGCVFGGKLTALRYPEKEIISIPAAGIYCKPSRPFLAEDKQTSDLTPQQIYDDLLDADDVIGKRIVNTRLHSTVTVREENATAALESEPADPRL
jgi:protein phosphatase